MLTDDYIIKICKEGRLYEYPSYSIITCGLCENKINKCIQYENNNICLICQKK
jgi:hypothetical protein